MTLNTNSVDFPVMSAFQDGDLRLVGSVFKPEGRVEIYHIGKWGTICHDWWGVEEANVTCKQLGYPLGAQYWYSNAYFGQGNGTIWWNGVVCSGNERKLINCKHQRWEGHNCRHYKDVAVVCRVEGRSDKSLSLLATAILLWVLLPVNKFFGCPKNMLFSSSHLFWNHPKFPEKHQIFTMLLISLLSSKWIGLAKSVCWTGER